MEAVIEKVTLYDILGYGFPGFFMLFILLIDFFNVIPDTTKIHVKDYGGILVVVLIVLSHVVGVLLSEIGKRMLILKGQIQRIPVLKGNRSIPDLATRNKKAIYFERALESVNKEDLKSALSKSGSSYDLNDERAADYIYSVIQVNPEFSRIHSYASAEVMSRNSATACLIGGFLALILCVFRYSQWFDNGYPCWFQLLVMIVFFLCSRLMYKRSITFGEKKMLYACNWFIIKYRND